MFVLLSGTKRKSLFEYCLLLQQPVAAVSKANYHTTSCKTSSHTRSYHNKASDSDRNDNIAYHDRHDKSSRSSSSSTVLVLVKTDGA
jgi:hypothetical protein